MSTETIIEGHGGLKAREGWPDAQEGWGGLIGDGGTGYIDGGTLV